MEPKSAWERWSDKTKKEAFVYCDAYREFLSISKTERKAIAECVTEAEKAGFRTAADVKKIVPGTRVRKINRDKQAIFCIAGKSPLTAGARFIVAHVDCPRLDLKASPVYEEENLALFKTCYYGGIKKYQWFGIPLALYGTVVMKNGEKKTVEIGDKPGDPVFTVTDLLPHLAKDQMKKTIDEGFPGENLNILAGSIPLTPEKEKEKVKKNMLALLKKACGMSEDDFISSEFEAVPAGAARDLGFDRGMLIGYGQDDRVCAYSAFRALLDTEKSGRWTFCLLADQEEIGSRGVTSAQSAFFDFFVEEMLEKSGGTLSDKRLVYENSKALSGDVAALLDPNFKDVHDPKNAARPGCGVVLERTTGARGKSGSIEACAEYLAYIRKVYDKHGVVWQPGELGKVEQGGGGTVSTFFARFNMDTVDSGCGILSMHAPFEVTSKADVYSTYLAYKSFYEESA